MLNGLVSAVEITKVNTYLLYMEERLECFHLIHIDDLPSLPSRHI